MLLVSVLALLLLLVVACSPTPKISVAATTLPAIEVAAGEQITVFRFVVTATKDTEIERLVLKIWGDVKVERLQWDETQETAINYQTSENNKMVVWPLQTIVIPAKATTFSVKGDLSGQGYVSIQLVEMGVKKGNVEGLPSAITSLEIK